MIYHRLKGGMDLGRLTAVVCAAVMMFTPLTAYAEVQDKNMGYARGIVAYEKKLNGIKDSGSLLSGAVAENAGTDSSDWLAIGVLRFGLEDSTAEYHDAWEAYITDAYAQYGGLDKVKATEWHRAVLTALALGADPTDVKGIDLLADGTYARSPEHPLDEQGLNGEIWALIALDSCDWKIPDTAALTREQLVTHIISVQHEDGGFSLDASAKDSDPDLTAMAVQALAPYRGCKEVSEAADKALGYLSADLSRLDTCESVAQCVCALCCMGIDPRTDARFSGITDELYSYARNDGGFAHEKDGASSEVASAQTLIALCSLSRLEKGERTVYDFIPDAPVPLAQGTLKDIADAKNMNTECPVHGGDDAPVLKGTNTTGIILIVGITAACSAAFTAVMIFRKRKEREK